jgi:Cu+-exporting ATPase
MERSMLHSPSSSHTVAPHDDCLRDKTVTSLAVIGKLPGVTPQDLLQLAAAAEASSEHPLAQAVINAVKAWQLTVPAVTDFRDIPGHGLRATVDGHRVLIGNRRLMVDQQTHVDRFSAQADALS